MNQEYWTDPKFVSIRAGSAGVYAGDPSGVRRRIGSVTQVGRAWVANSGDGRELGTSKSRNGAGLLVLKDAEERVTGGSSH